MKTPPKRSGLKAEYLKKIPYLLVNLLVALSPASMSMSFLAVLGADSRKDGQNIRVEIDYSPQTIHFWVSLHEFKFSLLKSSRITLLRWCCITRYQLH